MNVYRALRRGTALRALAGLEPFVWVRRRPGVEEFGSRYGRWAIDTTRLGPDSVIASFGLGEDITFEDAVMARFGCRVLGFDPTPRAVQHLLARGTGPCLSHFPVALAVSDGVMDFALPPGDAADQVSASAVADYGASGGRFSVPCRSLPGALQLAGVPRIDVLKLDIEGAEYGVLDAAAEQGWLAGVSQVLVEFHHFLPGLCASQTRAALALLRGLGYDIAWVGRTNHEYLFVRT